MGEMAKVCPFIGMLQLDHFFGFLLEKGYTAEVSAMIAVFIEERRVDKNFQSNFLKEIQEKYPYIGDSLK